MSTKLLISVILVFCGATTVLITKKEIITNNYELTEIQSHALEDGEDIFLKRREKFKKVCEKYNNFFRPQYRGLYNRDTKKIHEVTTYFRTKGRMNLLITFPKVGSTSWLHYWNKHNIEIGEDCDNCGRSELKNIIIQVRHPLEKLVSAYRHVIETKFWPLYFNETQRKLYEEPLNLTFPQFVDTLIQNQHIFPEIGLDNMYDTSEEVNKKVLLLGHFVPYWFSVPLCLPDYSPDIIIKMETIGRDFNEMKTIVGLPANSVLNQIQNGRPGKHSSKRMEEYLSQLTKFQLEKLNEMFQLDYELFGYSPYTLP